MPLIINMLILQILFTSYPAILIDAEIIFLLFALVIWDFSHKFISIHKHLLT